MIINLAPNVDFRLNNIIKEIDRLPIFVLLSKRASKAIGRGKCKAKIDSYPVFNSGGLFELEFEFTPHGSGLFVTDYIYPMAMNLRTLYDNLKPDMDSYHLFSDLWVEKFYFDTETNTFGWELGS